MNESLGDWARWFDEFNPFYENYLYRNFVFSTADTNGDGSLNTGAGWDPWNQPILYYPPKYLFQPPATVTNIDPILSPTDLPWTFFSPYHTTNPNMVTLIGITLTGTNITLASYAQNLFGLQFQSADLANGVQTTNLAAGATVAYNNGVLYPATANPILSVPDSYYFCNSDWDPYPGLSTFSPTNTSPQLVVPLGWWPVRVAGYSKHHILNVYSAQYAYLGQYFQGAYLMDTNGVATTNQTGLLSEYGEFFPTQPGAVALITTNNWGTSDHGTGVVQVIALCTDANRDGVIDPNFYGPDNTSWQRPFRFWVNDSHDSGDDGGNGIPGQTGSNANGQDNNVNGTRDLVNFFPVSLEIQSLLQAYPSGTFTCWLMNSDSALNYVDPDYIELPIYSTNCLAYLTDTNLAHAIAPSIPREGIPTTAPTHNITPDGVILSQGFVEGVREGNGSVLLIEAKAATQSPLVLEIRQGTNVVADAYLYLSVSEVEQMFRHKNLIAETFPNTNSLGAPPDRLLDGDVPNEPDTNDKNFVFLHGYNKDPQQARGMFADVFKRLYWSGSHAKFYAVTWFGSDSQDITGGLLATDYHINVLHAFETAPHLASFLATLTNGLTTVVAHSLGNMVALSALNDYNARMSNYFMLDAAVAIEAIDGGAGPSFQMTHSTWVEPDDYSTPLYASYWWTMFPTTDARSTLTWSNRFGNFQNTQVYNFYSSGEEVLREFDDDPPVSAFGAATTLLNYWYNHPPFTSFVWVWQEKGKGVSPLDTVLGSTHGGWKFNTNAPYYFTTNGVLTHMPNSQASLLSASQLQTNAFFDMSYNYLLFNPPTGSAYAQENRDRILSDAVPAMTWAVGSHHVNALAPSGQPDRNFDMNALYENGWPLDRTGQEALEWHHGDFCQVAYTFTYQLFNKWVSLGNLK